MIFFMPRSKIKDFSYPMIVKPVNLGSSVGIRKVKDRKELEDAIDYGFEFSLS